jgi:hypothetical protein
MNEWLPPWLLPVIPWTRIYMYFIAFYVTYSAFSIWSYRFSIRAVGVREATFAQAVKVRVVDIALLAIAFVLPLPWVIKIGLLFVAQVAAFALIFKAPIGKALVGSVVSWVFAGMFTTIYVVLLAFYVWFFRSLPYFA